MSLAMGAYTINDAIIKYAGTEIGMFQTIFVRGIFCTIFVLILGYASGGLGLTKGISSILIVGLRAISELVGTLFFVMALFKMPFANVTAILQILPLAVTVGAALVLREKFGIRRGVAICLGFVGVLIIIRPGSEGFNWYSILAFLTVLSITCRDLITRKLDKNLPVIFIVLVTTIVITSSGALGVIFYSGWSPMDTSVTISMCIAGFFLVLGYYFIVDAMRFGMVAVVSPFRYTIMIWALLLGFFIFGEVPDFMSLFGITLIVGAGIFTIYRETLIKKQID